VQGTVGTYVSGGGHVALIVWLLAGWGLSHDPIPFEVTEISVVSGEEYAALVAASAPNPLTDQPPAPEVPAVDQTPPPPAAQDTPPVPATPEEAPPPPVEEAPPPPAPDPIPPQAEVSDAAPEVPVQPQEFVPPPTEAVVALRPVPRPANRVAPEPVAPPPPDAAVADVVQQEVAPQPDAPAVVVVEEAAPATAPEEAATQIVTEADRPASLAPAAAVRPQARPARPAAPAEQPAAQTATQTATPTPPATDGVADALAAALSEATSGPATPPAGNPGPPMTGSERDAFRVAVNDCWAVDVGSEASRVSVTVAFSLGRDGKVQGDVRMVSATGGSDAAISVAAANARRAILRCQTFNGRNGYPLPADKYEQWREVEITFDPTGMRLQ